MPAGRRGSIGFGKEAAFGTGVAPSDFVNATESIREERGRLREPMTFGSRSRQPADAGRVRITGPINGIHARPKGTGHFLRGAIGAPVSAVIGVTTFYTHTFTPGVSQFSDEAPLPPYSFQVKRKSDLIQRYAGGQLNRLTLRQPKDDALAIDTDWIFKGVAGVADTVLSLPTDLRFRYKHLTVQRAAVDFDYVEDLTIVINNALETEETLNASDEISAVEFGESEISVQMTLAFRSNADYDDFVANTTRAWNFKWTITAAEKELEIKIPKLNIDQWSAGISGPGRMTVSARGIAEYDSGAGHELQAILTNDLSAY
jgi:hypothetical protein